MRPPLCAVCDERFSPFDDSGAGLVSFARDPADAAWYRRAEEPGFTGHPPHQEWFCARHAPQARGLSHETRRQALTDLRFLEAANAHGPLAAGHVRVVVIESSGAMRFHDFDALEAARSYADEVGSESDEPTPVAVVVDGSRIVARGKHYAGATQGV
jgi:hypothetical protein